MEFQRLFKYSVASDYRHRTITELKRAGNCSSNSLTKASVLGANDRPFNHTTCRERVISTPVTLSLTRSPRDFVGDAQ
jgi:hypothetical protein